VSSAVVDHPYVTSATVPHLYEKTDLSSSGMLHGVSSLFVKDIFRKHIGATLKDQVVQEEYLDFTPSNMGPMCFPETSPAMTCGVSC
jgi:hypothetical protein